MAVRRYVLVGFVTLLVSSAMYVEMVHVPHTGESIYCVKGCVLLTFVVFRVLKCVLDALTRGPASTLSVTNRSMLLLKVYYGTFFLYLHYTPHTHAVQTLYTGQGPFVLLKYLFGRETMTNTTLHQLCLFAVYKFIATLLSVTLPLPVGLFTPTFVTGGLIGRILGEYVCCVCVCACGGRRVLCVLCVVFCVVVGTLSCVKLRCKTHL